MNHPSHRRRLLLLLLYFIGLLGGVAVILMIPFFRHAGDLQNLAGDAAAGYEEGQGFGYGTNFGLSFLAYDQEGTLLEESHFGPPGETFLLNPTPFLQAAGRGETQTCYGIVDAKNEAQERSRSTLCILCGVPLRLQENSLLATTESTLSTSPGCLVLLRDMEGYIPLLVGFGIFWTSFALVLLLFLHLMERGARQLESLRRTYIAGMSHELKTPITSIKALTETLLYGYVEDEEKRVYYYGTILREANLLEDTVLKILELSKLQSKSSLFQRKRVSFREAFGEVMGRYQSYCEDAQIELHLPELDSKDLPELFTSPALISRVLELLLHNSVKYVPEEGGEIWVEAEPRKDRVLLSVQDNGCGIKAQDLPKIFEQFYRSESSLGGSGLGLSIVKTILDGLGEEIQVQSMPGKTRFCFSIARAK